MKIKLYEGKAKATTNWILILVVILTIIFAVAKIFGLFLYSWWWVFAPLLIYLGFVLLIIVIAIIIAAVASRY